MSTAFELRPDNQPRRLRCLTARGVIGRGVIVKKIGQTLVNQLVALVVNHPRLRAVALVAVAGLLAIGVDGLMGGSGDSVARTTPAGRAQGPDGTYVLSGRVVKVIDGDTFHLLEEGGAMMQNRLYRIRMASIDAPEMGSGNDRPSQPYGRASRDALADLIAGRTLSLHCFESDRYSRHICDVPLSGGPTVNRRMVSAGMAWANQEKRGQFLRDRELVRLENEARQARRGMWQEAAVPPWQWRYQCWQEQQC